MAKGKYEYWLTDDGLLLLSAWARDGATDREIAERMGIAESTLYDWKNKYPKISEALKKGKEIVDIGVENALLKKALGFKETVRKPLKVRRVEYSGGKRLREYEEVVDAEEEIFIPPDTAAEIFWLKNRKPATWRDRPEGERQGVAVMIVDDIPRVPESRKTPADTAPGQGADGGIEDTGGFGQSDHQKGGGDDMNRCAENVIEFSENQGMATVTFSQGRYKGLIRKLAAEYPGECEILAENRDESLCAHIPAAWIRISPPAAWSRPKREPSDAYHSEHARSGI